MLLQDKLISREMVPRKRALIISTIPITVKSFYLQIAEALKQNGLEIFFAFSKGPEADIIGKLGYKFKILPMSRNPFYPGNILSIPILALFLRKNKIYIIETTTPVASVVGRVAAIIARVPIRINTIRGLFPKGTHKYPAMLFNLVEKVLLPFTTLTITINREDQAKMLSKGQSDSSNVIIMPCGGCGVDLRKFNIEACSPEELARLRSEFKIDEDDFVVTFIGRLASDKGIFDLIEIIRMLNDSNVKFKFLIIGEAVQGEHDAINSRQLRALLNEERLGKKTIVTGLREDVPAILAISHIVVLPSYREGFGLVLAEAAAMGKLAVAYENAGTMEAIDDGHTGILVEKGDVKGMARAIEGIARDTATYEAMSKSAFEKAQREFNIEFVIDKYKQLYEGFLND